MKIAILYLAAGNSRRFGENKLLFSIEGKPMYRCLLDRLVQAKKQHSNWELIVVTQYPEVQKDLALLEKEGILRTVYSPQSEKGISYSIRAGLQAAENADACAFFVADQPFLSRETAEGFLKEMERKNSSLGCVIWEERVGNPVWFSRIYFPELQSLEGDCGGRKVFRRHEEQADFYPVQSEKELQDLDTKTTISC